MRVILTGGLGNQLFKFMAAQNCLEFSNTKKLTMDISWFQDNTQPTRSKHIFFQLQRLVDNEMYFARSTKFPTLHQFTLRKLNQLNRSTLLKLRIYKDWGEFYRIKFKPRLIVGDFENYKCLPEFSTVSSILKKLDSDSEWKRNLINRIKHEDPIIMHVRLGDYTKYPEIYGFLDANYYFEALQVMRAKGLRGPVWLTSDNPESALNFFSEKIKIDYVLETPMSLQPIELLLGIAESRNIIIAHSTFSWWAAWVSFHQHKDANIVMPSRFLRHESEAKRLQVPGWDVVKV
jgi:hypothetical protein